MLLTLIYNILVYIIICALLIRKGAISLDVYYRLCIYDSTYLYDI